MMQKGDEEQRDPPNACLRQICNDMSECEEKTEASSWELISHR
ncbi:hypothetical protein XELAEV_18025166mg [Xenopus laevis]|uniref:Uncharacterized protein n=1 Tax=Xenopus laevis TaxID=8355 RepID=A0A974HM34_XENLA|nr:hypothetical protein XELAEV_18025166mg [Xenopus laevis]